MKLPPSKSVRAACPAWFSSSVAVTLRRSCRLGFPLGIWPGKLHFEGAAARPVVLSIQRCHSCLCSNRSAVSNDGRSNTGAPRRQNLDTQNCSERLEHGSQGILCHVAWKIRHV